jgi:hypothetical protein
MNTLSRSLVLSVGAVIGLALGAGYASAYQPVVVGYYDSPPVVAYASPGPVVTTTRYGVFGLRRATTVYYGPTVPVVSSYYAPPVVQSYYAPPVVSSYYAPPVIRSYYYAPRIVVYP